MTKLNVIKKFNRTRLMRVALVLLMACFTNDMFGQQLYVHYATRDNGKDIVIPSDKRTEAKYFSINGNTIYSYSYPLKNVWKPTYQFSHSNEYYSVYYRVEPSYDEDDRIYLYEDGDIGVPFGKYLFFYTPTDESTIATNRNNEYGESSGGYYDGGSSSGSYSPGSSSSSGSTYQSTPQRCPACRGTGTCSNCHGTGWYQVSHTSNKQARCGCGNGRCRSCHGTGHR